MAENRCTCTQPMYPKSMVRFNLDPACPWHGQWTHLFNEQLPRFDADAPLPEPPPPTWEDLLETENRRLRMALNNIKHMSHRYSGDWAQGYASEILRMLENGNGTR